MRKSIKYKTAPKNISKSILDAEIIDDFLPSPEQLVFKEGSQRITLNLTNSSIAFFKKKAGELHVPYQVMIKKVVDVYARKFE